MAHNAFENTVKIYLKYLLGGVITGSPCGFQKIVLDCCRNPKDTPGLPIPYSSILLKSVYTNETKLKPIKSNCVIWRMEFNSTMEPYWIFLHYVLVYWESAEEN